MKKYEKWWSRMQILAVVFNLMFGNVLNKLKEKRFIMTKNT